MTTQINEATKIQIAVEVLKMDETEKTKKQIADEFSVSTRSVSRYADKYEEEALDLINTPEAVELQNAFEEPTVTDEEEEKEDAVEAKPELKTEEIKPGPRGGKKRNGRWELLNAVFAEYGLDTKSAELYKIVNERSVEKGLKPLSKGSFYAMVSIARKSAKNNEE